MLIMLSIAVLAQRDSSTLRGAYKTSLAVSAGVGASTIYVIAENPLNQLINGGPGANIISVGPAYNCMLDYRTTIRASFGIALAYQQLSYNPSDGREASWFIDNASRLNVGIRILEHFSKYPNADLYMGIRFGISFWSYDEILDQAYVSAQGPYYATPTPAGTWTETKGSVQILIGFKGYLSDYIGLHLEAGLGTPYYAEVGLTYRFYTRQ